MGCHVTEIMLPHTASHPEHIRPCGWVCVGMLITGRGHTFRNTCSASSCGKTVNQTSSGHKIKLREGLRVQSMSQGFLSGVSQCWGITRWTHGEWSRHPLDFSPSLPDIPEYEFWEWGICLAGSLLCERRRHLEVGRSITYGWQVAPGAQNITESGMGLWNSDPSCPPGFLPLSCSFRLKCQQYSLRAGGEVLHIHIGESFKFQKQLAICLDCLNIVY